MNNNFGDDFVAFLLFIFGGMMVIGGFIWLLVEIIQAVA